MARYVKTEDGTIIDTVEQVELGLDETVDLLNHLNDRLGGEMV